MQIHNKIQLARRNPDLLKRVRVDKEKIRRKFPLSIIVRLKMTKLRQCSHKNPFII